MKKIGKVVHPTTDGCWILAFTLGDEKRARAIDRYNDLAAGYRIREGGQGLKPQNHPHH